MIAFIVVKLMCVEEKEEQMSIVYLVDKKIEREPGGIFFGELQWLSIKMGKTETVCAL